MAVLVVQNYEGSGLGQIEPILADSGFSIHLPHPYCGDALPADDDGYQALIVLGGEQNALADTECPYFPHLLDLICRFGDGDKAVLGICLGSQLIARAFGGQNILDRPMEFGWHEVRLTEEGRSDPVLSAAGDAFPIFHWHRDTFSLPKDALHMATSDMTPHQAYRIGRAVYGTQFHFEANTQLVTEWNDQLSNLIAGFAPDWAVQYPVLARKFGMQADAAGAALAKAWVAQI